MSKNTYDYTDDFFAKNDSQDKRGRLFMALNYNGNYTEGVNTRQNPDTIKYEPIFQLMLAKNYNNDATGIKTPENAISLMFLDFIVKTAANHKFIDTKVFGIGS